ncbi:uncharacterized protein LOC125954853 [Anopheles darlingi]|uniref:uncharacterized protein LOC125954853 n=1 Tax=Anopheles darlingi TaxID=43151 RepID=UPI0021005AA3|nr:uncharacterized protein LOC125954853 [Anopheles darlingi]
MHFDPIMYSNFLEPEKLEEIRKEFAANGRNVDSSGESSDEEAGKKNVFNEKNEKDSVVRQQLTNYVKNTLALYHMQQCMTNIMPQENEQETLVESLHKMSVSDNSEISFSNVTPSELENVPKYLTASSAAQHNYTLFATKEKSSTSSTRSMISRRSTFKPTLRSQNRPLQTECVFCRNNGEPRRIYQSHILRDENKAVVCPRLRSMRCLNCGATGSKAHTQKYCPYKRIVTPEDLVHMEATWKEQREQRSAASSTSSNVRRHLRN